MENLFLSIVGRDSPYFMSGRELALETYGEVWGTESLSTSNLKYAVVVQDAAGRTLANMNIQDLSLCNRIDSETYFGIHHWNNLPSDICVDASRICEYSGMAIHKELRGQLRHDVFRLLVGKTLMFSISKEYTALSTVQRLPLIRKLKESLGLPFTHNVFPRPIVGKTPNDGYWCSRTPPGLYYLNLLDKRTVIASNRMYMSSIRNNTIVINSLGEDLLGH